MPAADSPLIACDKLNSRPDCSSYVLLGQEKRESIDLSKTYTRAVLITGQDGRGNEYAYTPITGSRNWLDIYSEREISFDFMRSFIFPNVIKARFGDTELSGTAWRAFRFPIRIKSDLAPKLILPAGLEDRLHDIEYALKNEPISSEDALNLLDEMAGIEIEIEKTSPLPAFNTPEWFDAIEPIEI